jgi:predicted Zn-dependent protease
MAQEILRDAETETWFRDIARPIVAAAGLRPENVSIVLLHDNSINAFVVNGQTVYIHSGLLEAADNTNQVQGVIAHELGHIVGGHSIRFGEGAKMATGIMLLSILLGAAAMAAGSGDAGAGIMMAGQQAAMGKFLAFSRTQESSADAAGVGFLSKAGISGRGSLDFFKKIQNQEYRYAIPQDDAYGRTHPLSQERIAALEHSYKADPAWDRKTDPALDARFLRIKAKLAGFVQDPKQTLILYPETNTSEPARYARAYAWHKSAYPDKALAEVDSLVAAHPTDPFYLELKGQILLESGKPAEALAALRRATELTGNQPLIATTFGHALVATEDPKNLAEAQRVLRAAVARDRENPDAWYQLGVVYNANGDGPRARLASAEQQVLQQQWPLALGSAETALSGLPTGSADAIRAQDIAMQARAEIERRKKRK